VESGADKKGFGGVRKGFYIIMQRHPKLALEIWIIPYIAKKNR
jgi:hypothetical protein